jgi:hypothetical protein
MGLNAAAEWVIGALLTKGRHTAVSLVTTATDVIDVDCEQDNELTVMADMNGAASGDLTVTVVPYEDDNITLLVNSPLPAIRSSGPTFGGSTVTFTGTYDVSGLTKVRLIAKNNNAGTQTLNRFSWKLTGGGAS